MNIIIVKIKKKEIVLTQFIYTTKKELMKKNQVWYKIVNVINILREIIKNNICFAELKKKLFIQQIFASILET